MKQRALALLQWFDSWAGVDPSADERHGIDWARVLLTVHDELIFEVEDEEVEATIPVVRKVMEEAALPVVQLSVPIEVDAKAAANWDEAH